jgi:hypothetical protein
VLGSHTKVAAVAVGFAGDKTNDVPVAGVNNLNEPPSVATGSVSFVQAVKATSKKAKIDVFNIFFIFIIFKY